MSAAAMLRSAALHRRSAASFRRALFRRLHSSDDCHAKDKPSSPHPNLHLLETVGKSGHELRTIAVRPPKKMKQHTFLTVDEANCIMDRYDVAFKEFADAIRDKIQRDRRNRQLLRAAVLGGATIYIMHRFFGGGHQQQDSKETTPSHDD